MNQANLAKDTEIMEKSIARYENGLLLPPFEILEKIANKLKKVY